MQKLIDRKEFRKIDLSFRRNAGNLLNCVDSDESLRLLRIFLEVINSEPLIADFIVKHNKYSFDIREMLKERGWQQFDLPLLKDEEISFIYQLLSYAADNSQNYLELSYGYATRFDESIRRFNNHVTRRLVNYIGDYLQEWAIDMGYDQNPQAKIMITGQVGQLNFSENGNVSAIQYNNQTGEDINKITLELIKLINSDSNISEEEKADTVDIVEAAVEQTQTEKPKQGILKMAAEKLSHLKSISDNGTALWIKSQQLIDHISTFLP